MDLCRPSKVPKVSTEKGEQISLQILLHSKEVLIRTCLYSAHLSVVMTSRTDEFPLPVLGVLQTGEWQTSPFAPDLSSSTIRPNM